MPQRPGNVWHGWIPYKDMRPLCEAVRMKYTSHWTPKEMPGLWDVSLGKLQAQRRTRPRETICVPAAELERSGYQRL